MSVALDVVNPIRLTGIASQQLTIEQIRDFSAQGYDGVFGVDSDGKIFEYVPFTTDQVKLVDVEQNPDLLYLCERKF